MIKLIRNLRIAWRIKRWRWALLMAVVADVLGFLFVLIPPVQWAINAATIALILLAIGFRWGLLGALAVEVIPAIQILPAWTLVVLALASMENERPEKEKEPIDSH